MIKNEKRMMDFGWKGPFIEKDSSSQSLILYICINAVLTRLHLVRERIATTILIVSISPLYGVT